MFILRWPVGVVCKDIAIGAGGLRFDSRAGQIGLCRQRLATAATFFAQVLSRGNGLRHPLHASA